MRSIVLKVYQDGAWISDTRIDLDTRQSISVAARAEILEELQEITESVELMPVMPDQTGADGEAVALEFRAAVAELKKEDDGEVHVVGPGVTVIAHEIITYLHENYWQGASVVDGVTAILRAWHEHTQETTNRTRREDMRDLLTKIKSEVADFEERYL